jgi:phosphoglycerate dehydrogenase-like enzyme
VIDICLPSAQLRDAVDLLAPQLGIRDRTVVWDRAAGHDPEVAQTRFWVPGFLHANRAGARAAMAAMPQLAVVQTQSAGVDTYVGLVPDGVTLCDARGVHGSSTSEWALTAILSVLREFPRFERDRQAARWAPATTDELAGKRVLVIGAGDVGQSLARRLTACDAEVVMVARTARAGVRAIAELDELLPDADVVVLIVPKTSETIGLADAAFLARLPDGALVVNAARGPVLVTDALVAELESGRLRAALDVVDPEPLPPEHPLWRAPNLLITPHVGGAVRGLPARVAALVAAQLSRFDAGQPLQNVVSGEY